MELLGFDAIALGEKIFKVTILTENVMLPTLVNLPPGEKLYTMHPISGILLLCCKTRCILFETLNVQNIRIDILMYGIGDPSNGWQLCWITKINHSLSCQVSLENAVNNETRAMYQLMSRVSASSIRKLTDIPMTFVTFIFAFLNNRGYVSSRRFLRLF